MPARDSIHDAVKAALSKDGWTITHDPYKLPFGDRDVYADLGAERAIAAEKGSEKIVVEVKSFSSHSEVRDLEMALGQFVFYRHLLQGWEPKRELWLAIPEEAYISVLGDVAGMDLLENIGVRLFTIDPQREEIVRWLK
ncbi:MAG: element excision factor XisH family protein [Pirellulaceae bacterium]